MNYTGGEHGIMAAIMAMTAPPTYGNQDSSSKHKQEKSGGSKKNNRAHAKESFCEGCGDPGEILLTCTSCSVSYHPVCDEPPLDEEIVKDLEWKCRCCRNKDLLAEPEIIDLENLPDEPELGRHRKPDTSEEYDKDVLPDEESMETDEKDDDEEPRGAEEVANKIANVFSKVIATAKTLNPVPFEIPQSFHLNQYQFPGTSRSQIKKPGGGKSKPPIVDLENYKVPVPVCVCFNCGKSCRLAPLLQCDYCPKLFHFDCLNPPLTSPPVGLWMCPLHVEPFLESKQLKSWQLSERVRIWDMTHQQIDRSTVVLNFMKKCARKHPPFSSKAPITLAVPYAAPDGCGNYVINADGVKTGYHSPDDSEMGTEEDQNSINRKRRLFKCYEGGKAEFYDEPANPLPSDQPSTSTSAQHTLLEEENNKLLDSIEQIEDKTEKMHIQAPSPVAHCSSSITRDEPEIESCDIGKGSEEKPSSLDMTGIDSLLEAAEVVSKKEERRMNFLKSLPKEQVYDLAAQKLEDVDTLWKSMTQSAPNSAGPRVTLSAKRSTTAPRPRMIAKNIIQFYCLNVAKLMKFSTQSIVIGTDHTVEPGSSSFNPEAFVRCKRLSGFHAVIFYDRSHMQWEILNYSPHGIIIDSVLYCLKPVVDKDDQPRNDVEAIKTLINKRRGILVEKARNPRIPPPIDEHSQEYDCPCLEAANKAILKVKHEGSATICVGSEIQIGCLKLVVKSMETEEELAFSGSGARKQ